ncbi:MAG: hypothetical protein C4K58_00900 [Flavobacteriaceae bacterium]|nr:MAG: hypothetical protein C4K58_00900 [Flavobacteriaceae bacterium]
MNIWKKTPLGGGASVLLYPNNTPTFEAASEGIFSLEIIYKEQGVGTTSYYPPIRSVGQMKVNYTGLSIVKTPVKCTSQTILTTNSEFKPVTITVDGRQFTDQVDFKQFETGVYQVSLEDSFGCTLEKEVDFVKNISVPTYFSPNGDNINDTWQPNLADCGSKVRIAIYDRYAHLVFTGGPTDPWDGTKNGVEMPEGDYWFIARFNDSEQQLLKGNITLKRR